MVKWHFERGSESKMTALVIPGVYQDPSPGTTSFPAYLVSWARAGGRDDQRPAHPYAPLDAGMGWER